MSSQSVPKVTDSSRRSVVTYCLSSSSVLGAGSLYVVLSMIIQMATGPPLV